MLSAYAWYANMEHISLYRKGGLHPVNIDDIFHNRYRVVNKLGHGGFATVWLVEDLQLKRFAALKVLTADASTVSSEIDVVRRLREQQQAPATDVGAAHVMEVFDDFEVVGPNGTHQCLVTELLGPSLAIDLDDMYEEKRIPEDFGKKLIIQISRGVAYLHKCGIVHADLHLGNILLYHPKLSHLAHEDIERYYGKQRALPIVRRDMAPITPAESVHLPRELFRPLNPKLLLDLCLSSSETVHIKICDFGEAFLHAVDMNGKGAPQLRSNRKFGTPRIYAAPEIIFHEPFPGPPTDIWALAVLMHKIVTAGQSIFFSPYGLEKEVVKEMVLGLGKLPQRWWHRWAEREEYFDENGVRLGKGKVTPLKSASLPFRRGMSHEYSKSFEDMVNRMVCYEMEDRISADTVVRLIGLMDGM